MGTIGQDADVAFFNLMHHFLAVAQKGDGGTGRDEVLVDPESGERRGKSRRTFRLTQRIAPGYCWEVPPDSAWIDVQCYDLTQGGFSFFSAEKPNFERLVANFRAVESIYVAARVIRWRPVMVDAWGNVLDLCAQSAAATSTACDAESKFLVGCQLLRRFGPS